MPAPALVLRSRSWECHDGSFSTEPESIKEGSERPIDALPLKVLNNYFSIGIDADIALQFHRARNSNPGNFTSRTRNLIFYGVEGGKDLFKHKWRNLMSHVTVECDGVDFTKRLADYGAHSVLVLNIPSYSGGTKPWNSKTKGKQEVWAVPISIYYTVFVSSHKMKQIPFLDE